MNLNVIEHVLIMSYYYCNYCRYIVALLLLILLKFIFNDLTYAIRSARVMNTVKLLQRAWAFTM